MSVNPQQNQVVEDDDVLDTKLLSGKGRARSNFVKTVHLKDGETARFRLLANRLANRAPIREHWYYWLEFQTKKEDGTVGTTWRTVRNKFVANGHKNPIQKRFDKVSAELVALSAPFIVETTTAEGTVSKRVDLNAMPEDIKAKYRDLTKKQRLYRAARHFFINAVNDKNELVILKMPLRLKTEVEKTLTALVNDGVSTNPISIKNPERGVWIEISRTGTGPTTSYSAKGKLVRAGAAFKYDMTPVPATVIENYVKNGPDLDNLFPILDDAELEAALNGDFSVIDAKRDTESTGTEETVETPVTAVLPVAEKTSAASTVSLEEVDFDEDDDIPTIDL